METLTFSHYRGSERGEERETGTDEREKQKEKMKKNCEEGGRELSVFYSFVKIIFEKLIIFCGFGFLFIPKKK